MAAVIDGPQAHLLSLKVMRVSRPELSSAWQPFYSSSPSFSAHSSAAVSSLQGSTPLSGHPKTLRDLTHASELLTLPSSFGSIQLGETFSSCLCVNNEKQLEIEVTQFKVEMQTVTAKVILHEIDGSGNHLAAGDTLEHIVHHEIKELGQHVLACTVTYRLPPNYRSIQGASEDTNDPSLQTFRKFYKFVVGGTDRHKTVVTNPLSVKTKVHSSKSPSALLSTVEREKIFLEIHIQNLTQDAICFERMSLECTDGWAAVDGNMLHASNDEQSIFSGSMALMQPQDIRQYIYILTPTSIELLPAVHVPGSIIPLGRLDISWKSSFGEPGRLLTSMLSRRIPPLPAPQPASALPAYLKRSTPSRPHSPQLLSQSRPGTPPIQRPGSPMSGRPAPMTVMMPQSTSPTPITPFIAPELDVQLFIRQSPGKGVPLECPFSISFGVVLSTTILPGKEGLGRKLALAVQYASPRAPNVDTEAVNPGISFPGVPTPSSAPATSNYTLAHQKIMAASSRPLSTEALIQDTNDPSHSQTVFPPPYFEETSGKVSSSSRVVPVGPSLLFLPPVELGLSNHQEGLSKVQLVQEFDMTFVALQRGLSTVGGVRILLVDDDLDEGENKRMKSQTRARVLKEYDVIGELWVSASLPSS